MKTTSIINLKGGVAKTLTAVTLAYVLAVFHGKRVLLVDNDKQGNATKSFAIDANKRKTIADILAAGADPREVIRRTAVPNLDIIPANMRLLMANIEVQNDRDTPQQTRLRDALAIVANDYDYCIIDNPPDINISVINGLVCCDNVIIPVRVDDYAFSGLAELKEQIENARSTLNPGIQLLGCLITNYQRTDAERQGAEYLEFRTDYPVFKTRIRWSKKVAESTFAKAPIVQYSRRSAAAMDYIAFTREYLAM